MRTTALGNMGGGPEGLINVGGKKVLIIAHVFQALLWVQRLTGVISCLPDKAHRK